MGDRQFIMTYSSKALTRFNVKTMFMCVMFAVSVVGAVFFPLPLWLCFAIAALGAAIAFWSAPAGPALLIAMVSSPISALGVPNIIGAYVALALLSCLIYRIDFSEYRFPNAIYLVAGLILIVLFSLFFHTTIYNEVEYAVRFAFSCALGLAIYLIMRQVNWLESLPYYVAFMAIFLTARLGIALNFEPLGALSQVQNLLSWQQANEMLGAKMEVWVDTGFVARTLLPGEEPNFAAVQLAVSAGILAIAAFNKSAPGWIRSLALLVCVGYLYFIAQTYSRTGLACIGLIGLYIIYSAPKVSLLTLICGLASGSLITFLTNVAPAVQSRFASLLLQAGTGASDRSDEWRAGLEVFFESPIFGSGFLAVEKYHGMPAHNTYIDMAATSGLGALIFLMIMLLIIPAGNILRINFLSRPFCGSSLIFSLVQIGLTTLPLHLSFMMSAAIALMFLTRDRNGLFGFRSIAQ